MHAVCIMGVKMNTSSIRTLLAAAMSLAIISSASAAPPAKTATTSKGPALTDARGMSLYTFDKDSDGKSACNGPCAANWPALKAEASDSAGNNYTVIARDDGSKQWAYKGKPLYTFVKDQKAGDISGDGFLNGAWHLAQP
jgi:predicted lipoprotein with Yx(FWY)xxD motif